MKVTTQDIIDTIDGLQMKLELAESEIKVLQPKADKSEKLKEEVKLWKHLFLLTNDTVLPEPVDTDYYEFDSYTTGRKQDDGHHTLNAENNWVCFSWDRGDYTETMEMKRPKNGKWLPYRVYTYVSTFRDFLYLDNAKKFAESVLKEGYPRAMIRVVTTGVCDKTVIELHKEDYEF